MSDVLVKVLPLLSMHAPVGRVLPDHSTFMSPSNSKMVVPVEKSLSVLGNIQSKTDVAKKSWMSL